jgi:RNA polymerase sigma-70 factor (ECF subfamily)
MNIEIKQKEFLILYDENHDKLTRFVRAMVRNTEEAKDVIGETVLIAYEKFETIRNRQAFLSFIFTIASRVYKKRLWRHRIFKFMDDEPEKEYPGYHQSPELDTDIAFLYKSLEKLPEKMKEAVVLFEISGFSIQEIQEIQGGTLSGVKSRLKRGRERLAEILGVNNFSEETTFTNGKAANGTVKFKIRTDLELSLADISHEKQ